MVGLIARKGREVMHDLMAYPTSFACVPCCNAPSPALMAPVLPIQRNSSPLIEWSSIFDCLIYTV